MMKAKTLGLRKSYENEQKAYNKTQITHKNKTAIANIPYCLVRKSSNVQLNPSNPGSKKTRLELQLGYNENKKVITNSFEPKSDSFKRQHRKMSQNLSRLKKTFKEEASDDKEQLQSYIQEEDQFMGRIDDYIYELKRGRSLELGQKRNSTQLRYLNNSKESSIPSNRNSSNHPTKKIIRNTQPPTDKISEASQSKLEMFYENILKEKQINRKLQKNVIEFQKILWRRTQKLDKLEKKICSFTKQNKQNQMNAPNKNKRANSKSKQAFKDLTEYLDPFAEISIDGSNPMEDSDRNQFSSSVLNTQGSECNSSLRLNEVVSRHKGVKQRRSTELPSQLERMIQRTLGLNHGKEQNCKNFNKKGKTKENRRFL